MGRSDLHGGAQSGRRQTGLRGDQGRGRQGGPRPRPDVPLQPDDPGIGRDQGRSRGQDGADRKTAAGNRRAVAAVGRPELRFCFQGDRRAADHGGTAGHAGHSRHPRQRAQNLWQKQSQRAIQVTFSGRGQTADAIVGGPRRSPTSSKEMFAGGGCDSFVIAATYVPAPTPISCATSFGIAAAQPVSQRLCRQDPARISACRARRPSAWKTRRRSRQSKRRDCRCALAHSPPRANILGS